MCAEPAPADESRDPLDLLAEQFLQQVRQSPRGGAAVTPEAFAAEHPEHRQELLDLLPTLLLLEQAKRERESTASSVRRLALPQLERLGEYRIVREVGRGGMGVVFEAEQESLGRRVALKVLPQASLLTGNQLERFRREAQTAARLHHTHIVPVFDSGEADGFHYYAMQFIDGQSLDHVVKAQRATDHGGSGALREQCRLAASVGIAVADALEHAHALGTLHRDIKPANLLLDHKQHVWVTDFGLAKALQQEGLTHSGDVLGTLQYMAPEQFDGRYDERSEVYALGATLYELIALRPAFAADTRSELIDRIRAGRCDRLSRRAPAVPRDLETIIGRAMAADARARYASAREFGDDLRAFLEDRPIAARRQSSVELLFYWCRRNRAIAAAGVVTVAAVFAAAVFGWTSYWTTDDALQRATASADKERRESARAAGNLELALVAFGEVFDRLVGPDPLHALTSDGGDSTEDGSAEAAMRPPVDAGDLEVLQRMLTFYDRFAEQNAGSASLREQTARAYGRVGAIQSRLGDHAAAVAAYEKALLLFRDVTDRDVTRDLAAMQQELGQVQIRRDEPLEAAACFEQSLKLLQADAGDRSRSARFLEARAHYLVATAVAFRGPMGGRNNGPGGSPRGGPGGRGRRGGDAGAEGARGAGRPESRPDGQRPEGRTDGGRGGGPGRELRDPRFRRLLAAAPAHLQAAQQLLADLLVEQADDAEALFLLARCHLATARLPGERRGDDNPALERATSLLQQLVAKYPAVDDYRFELCMALVPERRRPEVETMRACADHARVLVEHQPTHPEYRALLARSLSHLGSATHERDRAREPAAGLAQLAEAERIQQDLAAAAPQTFRFAVELQDTRRRLMRVQLAAGEMAAAQATGRAMLQFWSEHRRDGVRDGLRALLEGGRPESGGGGPEGRPSDLERLFERAGLGAQWKELGR